MDLRIDADTGHVVDDFLGFMRRLEKPAVGFELVADYLRGRELHRFATRGDGAWPPDSKETVRRKGNNRPLYDTGALFRSLTAPDAKGSVVRPRGQQMTFGTSLFYARFVSKKRPLFNTTTVDRTESAGRMMAWLMGAFE